MGHEGGQEVVVQSHLCNFSHKPSPLFSDTYLWNAYYVSCAGIGSKNTAVNNIDRVHALCILESGGRREQSPNLCLV